MASGAYGKVTFTDKTAIKQTKAFEPKKSKTLKVVGNNFMEAAVAAILSHLGIRNVTPVRSITHKDSKFYIEMDKGTSLRQYLKDLNATNMVSNCWRLAPHKIPPLTTNTVNFMMLCYRVMPRSAR